jgi:hypothetical protein
MKTFGVVEESTGLELGTRLRIIVSFSAPASSPLGKIPPCSLGKRLG